MHAYLKIKIKSLAAEASMIHMEERRYNPGHRARVRARRLTEGKTKVDHVEGVNYDTRYRHAFRLMRYPVTDKAMATFWGLREHRVNDVRSEARAALVAYGFLRGKTYDRIEPDAKTSPDWLRVTELVKKYGEDKVNERMARFEDWMKAVVEK